MDEWSIADRLLETYASSLHFVNNPEIRKDDVWEMLGRLDTFGSVRRLLSRSDLDNLPMEEMRTLVDIYMAALVTDMARRTGKLDHFRRAGIVEFQTEAERREAASRETGGYEPDFPAIEALLGEIPGMGSRYLYILNARLGAAMARLNVLYPGQRRPANPNACGMAFYETIGFRGLYDETEAALADYLVSIAGPSSEKLSKSLAAKSAAFFFLWHITLNHINDLVSELVGGPVVPIKPGICPECRSDLLQGIASARPARKSGMRCRKNRPRSSLRKP